MRPRNDEEKAVVQLHNRLAEPSLKQLNWMVGQSCERQAKKFAETKRKVSDCDYYSIVTKCEEWQVIRYFMVRCSTSKRGFDFNGINEVSQRWMKVEESGEVALHIFELQKVMCWQWKVHPYALCADLSLKSWDSGWNRGGRTFFNMGDQEVYPVRKFSESFLQSGLARAAGRYDEIELHNDPSKALRKFKSLDLNTDKVEVLTRKDYIPAMYETLTKMGERTLAYFVLHGIEYASLIKRYWKSFLVARRHGYAPKEWSLWFEYVHDLDMIGKDVHSPKYLCPADLGVAHGEVLRELYRIRERQKAERDRKAEEREAKKMIAATIDYTKRMGGYFGICIVTQSGLTITPLKSVDEFYEEGKAMHHCVYSNGYYKKPESLILSARDKDGKRVETIEVNLDTYRIVQSRGVCNSSTPFHDEIVKAMQHNMRQIKAVDRFALAA